MRKWVAFIYKPRRHAARPKKNKKKEGKKKREGDAKSRKEKKKTPFSPGRTGWGRRGEERRIRVGCPPQIRSIGPLRRTPRPPHGKARSEIVCYLVVACNFACWYGWFVEL